MPREYTTDEVREQFLDHVRKLVRYWSTTRLDPRETKTEVEARVSGVAFSILAMLDGTASLPGFVVAPRPHPGDKEFRASENENWFPENHEADVQADIAGSLHERFYRPEDR